MKKIIFVLSLFVWNFCSAATVIIDFEFTHSGPEDQEIINARFTGDAQCMTVKNFNGNQIIIDINDRVSKEAWEAKYETKYECSEAEGKVTESVVSSFQIEFVFKRSCPDSYCFKEKCVISFGKLGTFKFDQEEPFASDKVYLITVPMEHISGAIYNHASNFSSYFENGFPSDDEKFSHIKAHGNYIVNSHGVKAISLIPPENMSTRFFNPVVESAAVRIQSFARRNSAEQKLRKLKLEKTLIRFQALARGHLVRNKFIPKDDA